LIANKYKLNKLIGSGNFGTIYQGENIRTGELVAIKMESLFSQTKLLKNEAKVYEYLNRGKYGKNGDDINGFPIVKWFGIAQDHYCMAISLLGNSLQVIKNKRERFSLKITLKIGIQMVERLRYVHEKGLIHRDVKPDNFLIGLGKYANLIYLIDFGFCKKIYMDNVDNVDNEEHKKTRKSIIGTPNFASINVHKYMDPTRMDDLESVAYILIYFYLGKLPWDMLNITNDQMLEMKETFAREEKQKGIVPFVFFEFISLVRDSLNDGIPKYNELIHLMSNGAEPP